jgi:transcription elongation factor GreA
MDENAIATDAVSLGSTVKVLNCQLGAEITYSLVGSNETDPLAGKISDQSPIGAALIDKKVGDEVEITIPAGVLKLKVLEIARTKA